MSEVLSLVEAERLAERLLAVLDLDDSIGRVMVERVASDLAGLREHASDRFHPTMDACEGDGREWPCSDARRYSDGLRRTAWLYGAQEET